MRLSSFPRPDLAAWRAALGTGTRALVPELPDVLGVAGIAAIVRGVALWSIPAAWVVGGGCGVIAALGLSLIRHHRRVR